MQISDEISKDLLAACMGLLLLRAETDMTEHDAYHAMFKGAGRPFWDKAQEAVDKAVAALSADANHHG